MDKKYQVFVSSTFEDLKEERAEVIKALLEIDCIPCGMEFFPAANEDAWAYIEKLIKECDYYVVIVAGKYGSLTEEGISFTQKEYECACLNNVPTIAFIHSSPEDLPAKKTEKDGLKETKRKEFIECLRKKLCWNWNRREDLYPGVVASMMKLMKTNPRVGWVPASMAADPKDTIEKFELQNRIRFLEKELEEIKSINVFNTEDLASGDDIYEAEIYYSKQGSFGSDVRDECSVVRTSWNDIFKTVAPVLVTGCSGETLDKYLQTVYLDWFNISGNARLSCMYRERITNVRLSQESQSEIKVQLLALGLVMSDSGINHKGSWYLTESGKKKMLELMAIRKPKN